MAVGTYIKVNNEWKKVVNIWYKVENEWKSEVVLSGNISNMWKVFIEYGIDWRVEITPAVKVSDINKVIQTCPDNTEILFSEGVFNIDSPIVINRSNIYIRGRKTATTLKANFVDSTRGVIDIQGTELKPLENISICNLTIDGNK